MAFEYDKLKGKIKEKYGTQSEFAKVLGISNTTMTQKLQSKSDFTQEEITKAIEALGLKCSDVSAYFFAQKV